MPIYVNAILREIRVIRISIRYILHLRNFNFSIMGAALRMLSFNEGIYKCKVFCKTMAFTWATGYLLEESSLGLCFSVLTGNTV